jgi:hypothetical protein
LLVTNLISELRQKHQSPCERGFGVLSEHQLIGDQGLFDVLDLKIVRD